MPSLRPDRIRAEFFEQPNGDPGFMFTVIARKSGIEANNDLVGPREQGWASAAEHFGRRRPAAGFTLTHLVEAPHHTDATARYMPGLLRHPRRQAGLGPVPA